jgi:hypothetical protein
VSVTVANVFVSTRATIVLPVNESVIVRHVLVPGAVVVPLLTVMTVAAVS